MYKTINIPIELHKKLKLYSAENDIPIVEVIEKASKLLIEKRVVAPFSTGDPEKDKRLLGTPTRYDFSMKGGK